jgi:ribosomal protein S18 acetylase RimI-like enzyme
MSPSSTRTSATEATIRAAGPADIAACRELFVEYQRALGVSLCFQGFDRELAELPGDYVPPRGGLWLVCIEGEPAACAALRPLDAQAAEMKRLYVRPAHRGSGLGRRLVEHVIAAARAAGYRSVRLDTLPSMAEAQRLYEKLGFVEAPRYNDNPVTGVRFLALDLAPGAGA